MSKTILQRMKNSFKISKLKPEEDRNRRNQWIDKWMDELDQGNWLVGYNGDDRRRRETSEFVDPFDEYEMDWQRGVDTQIRLVT